MYLCVFLMEMQFFDRQYVKPIDGDYTNLKLSNLIPVKGTDE